MNNIKKVTVTLAMAIELMKNLILLNERRKVEKAVVGGIRELNLHLI